MDIQNKKGNLKIHVAVNIKTKEILALEVTDEKVNDGKVLKKSVDHILKCIEPTTKIKSPLADVACDSNNKFQHPGWGEKAQS